MYSLKSINQINCFQNYSIEHVPSTTSTNDDLKREWPSIQQRILIADEQTAGRGQFNRSWLSNKNNGLYFSYNWQSDIENLEKTIPLSMLVGISIYKTIQELAKDQINNVWIKWPNDIWLNNKKLSGTLVESFFGIKQVNYVIGVGINLLPFETDNLKAAGISEIIQFPNVGLLLKTFFTSWSEVIHLSTEKQLKMWRQGAHKFFGLNFYLSMPSRARIKVQPLYINNDGTLTVRSETGENFTLNSCQKLIPALDN